MNKKERNIKCVEYWMKKGFNEEDSKVKSDIAKKEGNQYCVEHWMKKGFNKVESKKEIERIKKENNRFNIEYWIKRGVEKKQGLFEIEKIREKQKQNIKTNSVYFVEYWVEKGYDEKGAIKKIEKMKKENTNRKKEYWIKKGFSEKDAITKVSEIQKRNSNKAKHKSKISQYNREYWIKKGIVDDDVIAEKISDAKIKSNPYKILPPEKIDDMINNRIKTYYSKSETEREKINKSRGLPKDEYIEKHGIEKYEQNIKSKTLNKADFIKKYGIEKYNNKINNIKKSLINRKFIKHSKISLELFDNIEIGGALYGNDEKCVTLKKDNKLHVFYLDYLVNDKVIEFYGDYYHGNPLLYDETDIIGSKHKHYTVKEKWDNDENRINMIKEMGYDVLIVWENDYKKNKKTTIELCKKWIKNL